MYQLIKDFPEQILRAIEIGEKATLNTKFDGPIKNIVVSGLGGSGIGGNLLGELLREDLSIPVVVNKGYQLPAFVDASTLLILCSYSGNTENSAIPVLKEPEGAELLLTLQLHCCNQPSIPTARTWNWSVKS